MLARWAQQRDRIIPVAIRWLIVVAILFLAFYFGRRASSRSLYMVIGGFTALFGTALLLRKKELGLVVLLVSAISIPFAIGTGTLTQLNIAILLIPVLLVLWLVNMAIVHSIKIANSQINLPLLAFVLSVVISFVIGNLNWDSFVQPASIAAQAGGLMIYLMSAGAVLWIGNQIHDLRWLKIFTWVFFGYGFVVLIARMSVWWLGEGQFPFLPYGIVVAIINPILRAITGLSERLILLEATGSLFYVWLIAIAAGQIIFNQHLKWYIKVMLVVLITTQVYAMWEIFRSWASGWLPTFVTLVVITWLKSWRWGLLVTIVGIVGIHFFAPDLISQIIIGDQYSLSTRQAAWRVVLEQVFPINPVFGLGPANYRYYTALFPILGWYVQFNSHNQYVDILAQTGIVGLIAFGWLFLTFVKIGWESRTKVGDGFAKGLLFGCLAGLVGTLASGMLADWIIPFVYNITMEGFRCSVIGWLYLGSLVSLEQMIKSGVKLD